MWHYLIRPCRNGAPGWLAMAKRTPFVGDVWGIEPGQVWFQFGATEEEAREKIEAEVRQMWH